MLPFRYSLTTAVTGSGSPELLRTFTTIVALLPLIAVCSVTPSWHQAGSGESSMLSSSGKANCPLRDRTSYFVECMEGSPPLLASLVLTSVGVKRKDCQVMRENGAEESFTARLDTRSGRRRRCGGRAF